MTAAEAIPTAALARPRWLWAGAAAAACVTVGVLAGVLVSGPDSAPAPAAQAAPAAPAVSMPTDAQDRALAVRINPTEAGLGFKVLTHLDLPLAMNSDDVIGQITLGVAICDGLTYGTVGPQAQVTNLINNGFSAEHATHFVRMAATYICPAMLPVVS